MGYEFKLKKADAPTQLTGFDKRPNWKDLASKIASLFHISSPDSVGIAFVDKHKVETVNDEDELQSFYAQHPYDEDIKFVVQDLKAPDTAITSTWSKDSNLSGLSKSDDMFKLFCWFLDGSRDPFSVEIRASKIVDDLKNAIGKYNSLNLWKLNEPELVDPDDTLAERIKSRGNNLMTFATRLSAGNDLLTLFPRPPRKNYLYILIHHSSTAAITLSPKTSEFSDTFLPSESNQVKRPGAPDVDREESKKPRMDMLPSESDLNSLHKRLRKINSDPCQYSDPHNMTIFPFPFIGNQLPVDRFDFKESHFEYMGRTAFSELWHTVRELKTGEGYSRLYIQGTMGYGKSHILAILAGLLSRIGKRVVYLPDCRELVGNTMCYMKTALLCAFADPLSSDVRNEIRALGSQDDVIAFCSQHPSTYFIIDQMNALDREDANMDIVTNEQKAVAQKYLGQLTYGHYRITSASANHKTAVHMAKKQTGERKLPLMGGMSEDEMKQWWIHHEKEVPIFGVDEKAKVEDLTGCIPLLLRPLLHFAQKPFHEIEQEFWTHHDLATVGKNVLEFAAEKMVNEPQSYERFFLPTILSCLTASSVSGFSQKWFDYRYFYADEHRGKCTCGLAREAAAIVIRQGSPGLLCGDMWIQSLRTFKNNPSVVGFLVEQACLSAISTTGFHHGSIKWQSFTATIFNGNLLEAIPPPRNYEKFFIPADPFFKDIDALYLKVDMEKKMVLVVPIQVTVAKTHKDSEAAFYSRWSDWQEFFGGYKLKTTFVWVVENEQSWTIREEEIRTTRNNSKLISPKHEQIVVTVRDINLTLGLQLAAIRR